MKTENKLGALFWFLLTISMIWLLSSCTSQRESVIKSDVKIDDNTKANISSEQLESSTKSCYDSISKVKISSFIENYIKEVNANMSKIEYDTEKPVDVTTGKPPIKSETLIDFSMSEQKLKKEIEELTGTIVRQRQENDSLRIVNKDLSEYNIKIRDKLESTEKVYRLSFWDNAQIWLGRILGVILIFVLIFRLRKK